MGIRLLLALALPLTLAVYILHFNRTTVAFRLAENLSVSMPIVILVFLSAIGGALLAGLLGWSEAGLAGFFRILDLRNIRRRARAQRTLAKAENLRTRGKIKAARRRARKAGRLNPELTLAFSLAGDLATEAGDLEEAIRCNKKLYSLTPDSLEALVRLSANYEAVGRAGEAEKMLLRMGERGAVHPDVLRRLRDMFAGQERWEESLAVCRKLASAWASPSQRNADTSVEGEILMSAAALKMSLSDGKGAASLFEQVIRCLPEKSAPRLSLGDACLMAGHERRAVKTWEEGYRHLGAPEFLHRIVSHHRPYEDEKARRQAASAMLSCGKMREGDPIPLVMAASLFLGAGRGEEARIWLEVAAEKVLDHCGEGSWVGVVMGLLDARGKLEAGDRLAAESAFQKVAEEAGRKILGASASGFIIRPAGVSSAG
jgi:tetratricopeptide (TPR) repeat protein